MTNTITSNLGQVISKIYNFALTTIKNWQREWYRSIL